MGDIVEEEDEGIEDNERNMRGRVEGRDEGEEHVEGIK